MRKRHYFLILGFLGLAVFIAVIIIAIAVRPAIEYLIPPSGIGGVWMGVGFIGYFVRKLNPTKYAKEETAIADERLNTLRGKASNITFMTSMVTIATSIYIAWITDALHMMWILLGVFAIHMLTYLISGAILNKRM